MSGPRPAFFRADGVGFVPTGLGLSPWDNRSQSGVSLAALIAHVIESAPSRVPMTTARFTLDILGAVPMHALTPSLRTVRDGPRFQLVEAALEAQGRTWARATALRVRLAESPLVAEPPTHAFPGAEHAEDSTKWFDMIRMDGGFDRPGKGAMWVRIKADAVEGVPLTPFQRCASIADFGSGCAPVVSFREWTSANLDISMHSTRMPRGEWLLVDARSESGGTGSGVALARIGDLEGMFGTAVQTTFLDRRET